MDEAADSFKTLILVYQTALCHITEDHNLKAICKLSWAAACCCRACNNCCV